MNITIERNNADGLVKWKWIFSFFDQTLWLNSYAELQRPTRRHGFKVTARYNRLDTRGSDLAEADVVLPGDVKEEAKQKFCDSVIVKRWSERG